MKIIGSICIITASTLMGFSYSGHLAGRITDLRLVHRLLLMLRGEVEYASSTFSEAFSSMRGRFEEPWKGFLTEVSVRLDSLEGQTFGTIWKEMVVLHLSDCDLTSKDIELLVQFGDQMGYLDKTMQLNTIDSYSNQISEEIKTLQSQLPVKCRLYNTLGIIGGIFLTIVIL